MHCELVVPALFAAQEIPRLPALELLLARGRGEHVGPLSLEAWLADKFGLAEGPLPAGAITLQATGQADRGAGWLRADPVHLRLERGRVLLIPAAACAISGDEAGAYVAALNRHFAGRSLFVAARPGEWCLRADIDTALDAAPPLTLAASEVDARLAGAKWNALLNEIQMALHDHPANAARELRGAPPVNSVWFWGAGRLPETASGPWHSLTADDALAAGFAQLAGMRWRSLPANASEWLERAPADGRHIVVLDALRAVLAVGGSEQHSERLAALEARWFAPLLDALRSERIGMITVHAPDSGLAHETIRGDLRRFWRRARPLAAYT
jgi:hypothetical protein